MLLSHFGYKAICTLLTTQVIFACMIPCRTDFVNNTGFTPEQLYSHTNLILTEFRCTLDVQKSCCHGNRETGTRDVHREGWEFAGSQLSLDTGTLPLLAHAINRDFLSFKNRKFSAENFLYFSYFCSKIDCGYTLELPRLFRKHINDFLMMRLLCCTFSRYE